MDRGASSRWLAVGLATLLGCAEPAGGIVDHVVFHPPAETTRYSLAADGPALVFLNRCPGGCTFRPGPDDSRADVSSIVPGEVHFPEFSPPPQVWAALVRCLAERFAPFEIAVTDRDPSPAPHFEGVVAGTNDLIGVPGAAGVSPMTCGVIANAINFTFAGEIPGGPEQAEALCGVVFHEMGHSFGLDHVYSCENVMTYLPSCGDEPQRYSRADQRCGEFSPRTCSCASPHQNSHLTILSAFGPRRTPLSLPPHVDLVEPDGKSGVSVPFRIWTRTSPEVVRVRFEIDGVDLGESTEPPHGVRVTDLPLGGHIVRATGFDAAGRTAPAELALRVVPPVARRTSALHASEPEGCTSSGGAGLGAALVLGLFALSGRRRRLAALLGLAACGDDSITGAGRAVFRSDPPPGAELALSPTVVGQRPPPRTILVRNEGEAGLLLSRLEVSGDFSVSLPRSPIPPGGEFKLSVFATRDELGDRSTTLSFATNDARVPRATYTLTQSVGDRCALAFVPDRLVLALDAEGELRLENRSQAECEVRAIGLDPKLFALLELPPLPLSLPPNEGLRVRVRHHTRTRLPGTPVRELTARARGGAEATASIVGQRPIENCASVFPSVLDFGRADPARPVTHFVAVANDCDDASLTLEAVALGFGGSSFALEPGALPRTIPPGGVARVGLRFLPIQLDDVPTRLALTTDDAARPRLEVELTGRPRLPEPVAGPAVDLGATVHLAESADRPSVCSSGTVAARLLNLGDGALPIERAWVSPDTGEFRLEAIKMDDGSVVDPARPFLLGAQSSLRAAIRYRPLRAAGAESTAALVVRHALGETSIPLRAHDIPDEPLRERFVAPAGPRVDVVFVVDDSYSMVDVKRQLGALAGDWLARAEEAGADHRHLVLPARDDPGLGGFPSSRCAPPHVISSADEGAADRLACALAAGASEAAPAGLGAAARLLVNARDPRFGTIHGFLREDAHLEVVAISNEDDLSRASDEALLGLLLAEKRERRGRVRIHALATAAPAACPAALAPLTHPGERYARLTARAHGTLGELCGPDLATELAAIADRVFAPRTELTLAARPDARTVEIRVDGRLLSPDEYTLDDDLLSFLRPLPPGADVDVLYSARCPP